MVRCCIADKMLSAGGGLANVWVYSERVCVMNGSRAHMHAALGKLRAQTREGWLALGARP